MWIHGSHEDVGQALTCIETGARIYISHDTSNGAHNVVLEVSGQKTLLHKETPSHEGYEPLAAADALVSIANALLKAGQLVPMQADLVK